MKRPPTIYRLPDLRCARCGEAIRHGQFGGFEHVRRIGIKDPRWHLPEVR